MCQQGLLSTILEKFGEDVIDFLLTLDYERLTKELVEEHIEDLYKPIDEMPLEEVKKIYNWFPKKEQIPINTKKD